MGRENLIFRALALRGLVLLGCLALLTGAALADVPEEEPVAYPTTQVVEVNGTPVTFQMYTVYNQWGFATNYVKLRDVAYTLNGSAGQFNVEWDGSTRVTTGAAYVPVGGEMEALSEASTYRMGTAVLTVDGVGVRERAILFQDNGGHTYFKLRDLGAAMGFTVDWSAQRGIYIETE